MEKILLAIPTSKYIENLTIQSMYNLKIPKDCKCELTIVQGYAVHQARNMIVQQALNGNFDYVFFIDSDIILPQDILKGLLEDNKDIISGYYIKKQETQNICELFGNPPGIDDPEILTNILENELPKTVGIYGVNACGFGCTLVKTEVFKKIIEKNPDDLCFDYEFKKNKMCSEDILFCKRAKEVGIETFVDTKFRCGHIGNKIF